MKKSIIIAAGTTAVVATVTGLSIFGYRRSKKKKAVANPITVDVDSKTVDDSEIKAQVVEIKNTVDAAAKRMNENSEKLEAFLAQAEEASVDKPAK